MKFAFYTNVISPHQLPLARELIKQLGEDEYRYVYTTPLMEERSGMGWAEEKNRWMVAEWEKPAEARSMLKNAEVLMSGNRDVELFERRAKDGKITLYTSERWFKPPIGIMRLLSPKYFRMAKRIVGMLKEAGKFYYLPYGIHAARDMAKLCGLMRGDFKCLFKAPELEFERKPGGRIWLKGGGYGRKYCLDKMRIFCYTVEKGAALPVERATGELDKVRVLWVGRLLDLKRVDTIVRAVSEHADLKRVDNLLPKITLDIYGTGPEEARLKKMAAGYEEIKFYPPVPIKEVRRLMREHDVYVLSSNGYEGWGAVVSEALEEGMKVIGTYEAGSSATMLPEECLFHAGDRRRLKELLNKKEWTQVKGWSATEAAKALMEMIGDNER